MAPAAGVKRARRMTQGDGWIGVDFDGTLATYESGQYPRLGEPVPAMVARVRHWLAEGTEVRIVTARADKAEQILAIEEWCLAHVGQRLKVTDRKDSTMVELWDDRAVRVRRNEGEPEADWRDVALEALAEAGRLRAVIDSDPVRALFDAAVGRRGIVARKIEAVSQRTLLRGRNRLRVQLVFHTYDVD